MLDCHVSAFLIKPGRVLGRKLRPLTLAHLWILEAANSPYVLNLPATAADMVFAVFILSMPPCVGRWFLMHPAACQKACAWWGRVNQRKSLKADMEAFAAYWKKYTEVPERWPSGGKLKPSCLPVSVNIAWSIMHKVGERRAWSMPLPLAMCYHAAESEINGAEYKTEFQKMQARLNAEMEMESRNG